MQPIYTFLRITCMTRNKWFLHEGRALEVRDRRVMRSFEIWIYENDLPLGLHSRVSLREAATRLVASGEDALNRGMERAIGDCQTGRFPAVA
jgi:hypothetical protein